MYRRKEGPVHIELADEIVFAQTTEEHPPLGAGGSPALAGWRTICWKSRSAAHWTARRWTVPGNGTGPSHTSPLTTEPRADLVKSRKPAARRPDEKGDWLNVRCGGLAEADVDNLRGAGRCISPDVVDQASFRIQQTCMALGRAAGVAPAPGPRHLTSFAGVDIAALREELQRLGARGAKQDTADEDVVTS